MVGSVLAALLAGQGGGDPRELSILHSQLAAGAPYEEVLKEVREALRRGADPSARRAEALLYFSASDRKGSILQALLQAGANPNLGFSEPSGQEDPLKPRQPGWTYPLHAAVRARNPKGAELLLRYGAKTKVYGVGLSGYSGSIIGTPLAICAQLPLKGGPRSQKLSEAEAEKIDVQIAGLLLKAGADIHWSRPNWKMTPLHWAALAGKPKLAAYLIRSGADKRRLTTSKWTPHDVARNNHPKNRELLRVLDFPGRKPGPPLPRSPVADL